MGSRDDAETDPGGPSGAQARWLSQRRAESMRALFPKRSAWRAEPAYYAELNAVFEALGQTTCPAELERAVREVQRRRQPWA